MTGKKHQESYRTSAVVSPVKEPIKSITTEYLLIDLKIAKEADGGEVDILELFNLKTDETRSLRIKREEGSKEDLVRNAWEKVNNSPNYSATVRVLDITWSAEDGAECTEGMIMDSHLWEN